MPLRIFTATGKVLIWFGTGLILAALACLVAL